MADGILIIDKPAGWTSMDVCAKLRGIFHEKKVGHAGTLDPMATGVLPVFLGKATKALSFAEHGEKTYEAVLQLGIVTDTQDSTGTVLERHEVHATKEAVEAVLPRFRGDILQLPPMYSAIKVNGQRLYDIARKGGTAERKERAVTIRELTIREQLSDDRYALRVTCSKGTYIRTLCHDIGAALTCGGCMAALRRTAAAGFSIDEAVTLEAVQEKKEALLLSLDTYFRDYPAFTLPDAETERRVRCGNAVHIEGLKNGVYRVYGADGSFLCLSGMADSTLRSIKNFFGE